MSSHAQLSSNRLTAWLIGGIVLAICLFRFYLVARDGIPTLSSDSLNYARQATYYLSGNKLDELPKQSPGLAILARTSSIFGIPYKLTLEGLLLLAAWLAGRLVTLLTGSRWCGLAGFGLIALNPWFIQHSRHCMSEPLTAVILLVLVLSVIPFFRLPPRKWSWGAMLLASLASTGYLITRPESPILIMFWAVAAILLLLLHRKRLLGTNGRRTRIAFLSLALPLVVAFGARCVLQEVHYRHYGIRALTVTSMDGFGRLLNALYTIPPEESIRFAPVTRQSLATACAHSPTLNKYRDRLLQTDAPAIGHAKNNLNLENEYGTWLNWHLVWSFSPRKTYAEINSEMKLAASEIRTAQDQGQLGKRWGRFPIAPDWQIWLPEVPMATWMRIQHSLFPNLSDRFQWSKIQSRVLYDPIEIGFYDSGLMRRTAANGNHYLEIFGVSSTSGFRRVRIQRPNGSYYNDKRILTRNGQRFFEFRILFPQSIEKFKGWSLEFFRHQEDATAEHAFRIRPNFFKKPYHVPSPSGQPETWKVTVSKTSRGTSRPRLQASLVQWYPFLVFGCMVLFAIRGMSTVTSSRRLRQVAWLVVFVVTILVGRAVFFALIEVWLNWGEYRYVEPNCLFGITFLVLFGWLAGATIRRVISVRRRLS